jgi:hypothetical protein
MRSRLQSPHRRNGLRDHHQLIALYGPDYLSKVTCPAEGIVSLWALGIAVVVRAPVTPGKDP